jgi:hypothetical protein
MGRIIVLALFCQGRGGIFLWFTGRICCWSAISKFRTSCRRNYADHTFNIFILKGITPFIILILKVFVAFYSFVISGRVMFHSSLNACMNLGCTIIMCICSNKCILLAYCQLRFYIKLVTPTLRTRWCFPFKHFGCL